MPGGGLDFLGDGNLDTTNSDVSQVRKHEACRGLLCVCTDRPPSIPLSKHN